MCQILTFLSAHSTAPSTPFYWHSTPPSSAHSTTPHSSAHSTAIIPAGRAGLTGPPSKETTGDRMNASEVE